MGLLTIAFNSIPSSSILPLMGCPNIPVVVPHQHASTAAMLTSLYFGARLSAQSCTSTRPLSLRAARWRWRKPFSAQATRNLRWTIHKSKPMKSWNPWFSHQNKLGSMDVHYSSPQKCCWKAGSTAKWLCLLEGRLTCPGHRLILGHLQEIHGFYHVLPPKKEAVRMRLYPHIPGLDELGTANEICPG